ncbi:hypothetical protein [Lysinibacillus xylanilyticus]|uniref:hypothetical protein n=1 Tax=Lysinibacillus xylanilyticus TaxID=582475 RepID=UPI003D00F2E9
MEKIIEMIGLQQKMMMEKQLQIENLQNKELPAPFDHSQHFEEMKNQLKFSQKKAVTTRVCPLSLLPNSGVM